MATNELSILIVGEANICRSPAAERILRQCLTPAAAVRVSSSGTEVAPGEQMYRPMAEGLARMGIDPRGHVSRRLTVGAIAAADLILTATREQASAVVTADVAALHRTFTLAGFGRLVNELPSGRGSASPEWMQRIEVRRGRSVPLHMPEDDLVDPYGADPSTIDRVLARLLQVCRGIANSYRA